MNLIRFAFALLTTVGTSVASYAPDAPVWLRLCDKRAPDGTVLAAGTRSWEEAPIRSDLLDSLRARGWSVRVALRWSNLVSAVPGPRGASLPACVEYHAPVASPVPSPPPAPRVAARSSSVDPAYVTLKRMHEVLGVAALQDTLLARGSKPGEGVRVAVIDDGFIRGHRVLDGARIVDAHDFVVDDSTPWAEGAAPWAWGHGTASAGLVASQWSLNLPGVAPGASLMLYRTEDDSREVYAEEDYLAAAIERAVDSGARVINVSLGYRYLYDNALDHPFSSMDGRTLVASRTATWAARRDVVVLAAIGNEGSMYGSRTVNSPADADSVLAIGAVSEGGIVCPFSSMGPTADGRIKPDLVAYGCSVPVATGEGFDAYYEGGTGTSYAAPLVAGMAVLLRQLRPDWTAAQVRDSLKASGSRVASPDTILGWGLPDLRRMGSIFGNQPKVSGSLPLVWPTRGLLRMNAYPSDVVFSLRRMNGSIIAVDLKKDKAGFFFAAPPPGIYFATWKGRTIDGSRPVVVPAFR